MKKTTSRWKNDGSKGDMYTAALILSEGRCCLRSDDEGIIELEVHKPWAGGERVSPTVIRRRRVV